VKRRDGEEESGRRLRIDGKWCRGGRGQCSPFIGG
jgi:hypothetical protein